MTVDDLIGAYIEASNAVVWEAEKRGLCPMTLDMHRIGVTAIVRALRDEFENEMGKCLDCSASGVHDHIDEVFNEILGSDAGEKVAGGSTREDGPGGVEQAVPALTPATPAAPAVCVWTRISEFDTVVHYSTPHGVMNDLNLWRGLQCAMCHAPIKFTEANHG